MHFGPTSVLTSVLLFFSPFAAFHSLHLCPTTVLSLACMEDSLGPAQWAAAGRLTMLRALSQRSQPPGRHSPVPDAPTFSALQVHHLTARRPHGLGWVTAARATLHSAASRAGTGEVGSRPPRSRRLCCRRYAFRPQLIKTWEVKQVLTAKPGRECLRRCRHWRESRPSLSL